MILSLQALALAALIAQSGATTAGDATSKLSDDEATNKLVADAKARLVALGYDVPASLRHESREPGQVLSDLEAQQELVLPDGVFELQHRLLSSLGLPAGKDAKELRRDAVAGGANGLSAYYDPLRKVFVILPTDMRAVAEALSGTLLPLVAHELVHAHQDAREGGLAAFFGDPARTLDSAQVRRCIVEGEADLVSYAALNGEAELRELKGMEWLRVLESMAGGELLGLVYDSGRRLALERYRAGGLGAVRKLWSSPPPSTEQVLHPRKLGRDEPCAVELPEIEGLAVARRTSVGELITLMLLRELGVARLDASLAAAGWDGDLLVLYERAPGEHAALVWRSAWDRAEDAADFARRLEDRVPAARGEVVLAGRVVDWIGCEDEMLRARIAAACAAERAQPAAVRDDAASTAAAEEELRAELGADAIEDEAWRHASLGLSVPIPSGWELREVNGVKMLIDPKTQALGLALNVNVMSMPRGELRDLEDAEAQNREQLARLKLTVDSLAITERDGVAVLVGEYYGQIARMAPTHHLLLLYLRGDEQVVVTATANEKVWAEHEEQLRKLMAGIRLTPP